MQATRVEMQGTLDMLPDAIILVDERELIVACNKQVSSLLGYQVEELIHQSIEILMPVPFREKHHVHVDQYFQKQTLRKMGAGLRLWALKKDGTKLDVDIALSPFVENGKTYAFAVIREITDKMILEQKIGSLERMKEELERFAYVVSHDLKAPLHRIKMLVNLITLEMPESDGGEVGKMVGYLHQSVDIMDKLIYGILEYTKVGSEEEATSIDLDNVLEEAKSVITIPDHFTISVTHPLPTIAGNHTKLTQIFLNLITNAIKFNKKEKGLLKIDWNEEDGFFEFSFADNGIVVAPEKRQGIFNLFTRAADDQDKTSHGIGLSIVKKIIEQAGGKIWYAESSLGGSEFRFRWPKPKTLKTIPHSN